MAKIQSFKPVVDRCSRVLILGSMPGAESIRQQQYYAHPRNGFWPFIYKIFNREQEKDYAQRIRFLKEKQIALWDVLKSCNREGSLDSGITNGISNDVAGLINTYSNIQVVFCNGTMAESQFRTKIFPLLKRPVLYTRLYSTSPANASVPYQKKVENWLQIRYALENRIRYRTFLKTASGEIVIDSNGKEIIGVGLPGGDPVMVGECAFFHGDRPGETAKEQIQEYLHGKRKKFSIPIKIEGTSFQRKVYEALLCVPFGETVSYRELAEMVGNKNAARAVGQAVRRNPVPILIPCHRVVGADGKTIGFMGVRNNPLQNMLLQLEQKDRGRGDRENA